MAKIAGSGSDPHPDPDPHQNVMDPEHYLKGLVLEQFTKTSSATMIFF
jgi:hypothetical protein